MAGLGRVGRSQGVLPPLSMSWYHSLRGTPHKPFSFVVGANGTVPVMQQAIKGEIRPLFRRWRKALARSCPRQVGFFGPEIEKEPRAFIYLPRRSPRR